MKLNKLLFKKKHVDIFSILTEEEIADDWRKTFREKFMVCIQCTSSRDTSLEFHPEISPFEVEAFIRELIHEVELGILKKVTTEE